MKHDKNQYYYSPSKNYPWFLKHNKPDDAIPMTVEMEECYEAGINQGFVITPKDDGFIMVHPDSLLTPEQIAEREQSKLVMTAELLLEQTNRFETSSFQAKYWTEEEEDKFEQWRHKLFDVVYEGSAEMPDTPNFVQQALDGNISQPLLQSVATPETIPKKRKTKSTTTEQ